MARFEIPGHRGEKHVSDLKGLLSWRQRPEVPSEKPKHKNNSMSKNKIPSSEVAGPGPSLRQALPLFPAHGGARPAGRTRESHSQALIPGRGGLPAARALAWPPLGLQPQEGGGRRSQAPPPRGSRSPRGRRPRPRLAGLDGGARGGYPLPPCPLRSPVIRPERKCADRAGPPSLRSGSAPPPPLRLAPRCRARRVPGCPV